MRENFVFLITFLQLDRIKVRATTLLQKQNSFLTMDGMARHKVVILWM
jgi:hypothetical protein